MASEETKRGYFDPEVLAKVGGLFLRARWVVEGLMSGIHRSRSHGYSMEFEEHREYSPGDEIRRIDWKALGKFDRFFVKEYEDETNLRAYVLLDCSASMDYGSGGFTKFQYAATLAACLAYLILRQQDAVGLVTFAGEVKRFVPPRAKISHMREILDELEARQPEGKTSIGTVLPEIAGKITRRGMVILISDLLDEPEQTIQALKYFRLKGNDVMVFHVLEQKELEFPFDGNLRFEDMEEDLRVTADPKAIQQEYLKVVQEFMDRYKDSCQKNSIDYLLLSTSTQLEKALVGYLNWRG
jgi:uncharacterized protein (DUF58 family)